MRTQSYIAALSGILGAVALTAGAGGANAATITETFNFDFGNDHLIRTATEGAGLFAFGDKVSRSHSFAQFDASLGTLQSATLTLATGGTNVFGATHDGGGTGTIIVNLTNDFGFVFGGTLAEAHGFSGFQQTFTNSSIAAGSYLGGSQNANTRADLNKTYTFDASGLASFIGGGTLDFEIFSNNIFESLDVVGSGLTASIITGSCDPNCANFGTAGPIGGTATVTYVFDRLIAVPEPGTLALLAAGLVVLPRRRKR